MTTFGLAIPAGAWPQTRGPIRTPARLVSSLTEGAGVIRRLSIVLALTSCAFTLWWARSVDAATRSPRAVVCATFTRGCDYALRIASCETGGTFDPRALGRAGERGWFQIHPVHFGRTLRSRAGSVYVNPARLYDPVYNTRVAYVLSNGGRNWQPWTCRRYV